MTHCILYARFSPRPDSSTSQSNEAQFSIMREHVKRLGWEIAGEYRDDGISGSNARRPGLWEAVEALRPGSVLLVTKLDRLARDVYLSMVIERAVDKKRATITSIRGEGTEGQTPEDRLLRTMMTAMDAYTRESNAARTSAAMKAHQKAGRRMSNIPPYGMMIDPEDPKRLVKCKDEQTAIILVLLRHSQNQSNREIARRLDHTNLPCRGTKWTHGQVGAILRREGVVT